MDTILGILSGESYSGIRALVDLSVCVKYTNSAHSMVPWVGGRHCVSVVLICCLPTDTPCILGHVVDHECDTPVEFFVVHSLNIGTRRVRLQRKNKLYS